MYVVIGQTFLVPQGLLSFRFITDALIARSYIFLTYVLDRSFIFGAGRQAPSLSGCLYVLRRSLLCKRLFRQHHGPYTHSVVITVCASSRIFDVKDSIDRSEGLPDAGYFGTNSDKTSTPLRAIWLCTIVCILPGLLDLASPIAANAIFSLTAMALDMSYIIPIFCRRVFHNHQDVMFKPGPFFMGNGFLGLACNTISVSWTLFVCVIFSLPNILPVTGDNMNYASVR